MQSNHVRLLYGGISLFLIGFLVPFIGGTHEVFAANKMTKSPVIEFRELDSRVLPPVLMKEVLVKHLLICFTGTNHCEQTRTKQEALQRIQEIRSGITAANFAAMAKEHSTEPGAKESGGSLGWIKNDGQFVQRFTDAALTLKKGQISKPVETEFGYHLIYVADVHMPSWRKTELNRKHLQCAQLEFDAKTEQGEGTVRFELTKQGMNLFSKITKRNIGKPLAIFLDGKSILDTNGDDRITAGDLYAPIVQEQITKGRVLITGIDSILTARSIVRRLGLDMCKPFTPSTYKKGKNI